MDWFVHQGHQYEFFKTGHSFYFSDVSGKIPDWNILHRPLNKNASPSKEADIPLKKNVDFVMVRSPLNPERPKAFYKQGAIGIAVVQTTDPFKIPDWVEHVVWNSKTVMDKWSPSFKRKKHYHIAHGFDPKEFSEMHLSRNKKLVSMYNVFKPRANFLGYDFWRFVSDRYVTDIWGHGNQDISTDIKNADSFEQLISLYNSYGMYLNTTQHSAMPRSRAEAMMCGMPLATTDNYDISSYLLKKDLCILTNDRQLMLEQIKNRMQDSVWLSEASKYSREVAVEHFHIRDYIKKWNQVFDDAK